MECGTIFVSDFEEYHLQMPLDSRDIYQFFLEFEMQTPIEDYDCAQ